MSNLILSILIKERPWANRSRQSLQNRDREQIALVDPYKRATVSESILSIFTKERCQWLACDSSESLSKNERFGRKKLIFCILSVPMLFAQSLFFTKEWPWAIRSGCSWQKSDGSNSLFFKSESLFPSFAHKKRSKPKSEFPTLV